MEKLRAYINSLPNKKKIEFAAACGTSLGYLRKAISINGKIGEKICIAIERESKQKIVCEYLRPDVDWHYIRSSRKKKVLNEKN
jgi:DNA-binding transcriptional regulator YdaS (Cro superfamily)